MVKPQLQTRKLNLWFGKNHVLHDVDLSVYSQKVTAMIGPSGCGKSTLLRCFNRMNDLIETARVEGNVRYHGVDLDDPKVNPVEVRRRIGLTAQDATVDPLLTGRENLVMLGELHQMSRRSAAARAIDLLEDFSLTDAADRPSSTYSGGMRRRLDLAATLVADPVVLFLDELGEFPVSHLDALRQPLESGVIQVSRAASFRDGT